jgi:glycosyl transferase family 1/glycosyl transferase family 4
MPDPIRVAFLTTVLPHERRTGSEVASGHVIDALRDAGHRVDVVGYARPGSEAPADPDTQVVGTRPIETASAGRATVARWFVTSAARGLPYAAAKYRSAVYLDAARRAASAADVIVLDHAQTGWLLGHLPARPTVLVAHNVEHRLYGAAPGEALPRRIVGERERRLMARLERHVLGRVDAVWAFTDDDARTFRSETGVPVHAFALPGRTAPPPMAKTRSVAALGTWTWEPNARGLRWFCDAVVPLLPEGLVVDVGGSGAEWSARRGVRYHGRVADADAFLATARVVAIPSTSGAGVQIKTLDALGAGAWVVATPIAVRGIDDPPPDAVVTDDPSRFAAAIVELVDDDRTLGPCSTALAWAAPRRARFADDVAVALSDLL